MKLPYSQQNTAHILRASKNFGNQLLSCEKFFASFLLSNKRHLRADSSSLHLSALRPRLSGKVCGKAPSTFSFLLELISKISEKVPFAFPSPVEPVSKKTDKIFSALVGLVFVVVFSLILQNSYVFNVNAASLTLTVPSKPLSLNLTPSAESNFAKSEPGQVSVITDNITGYTLSIKSGGEGVEEDDSSTKAKLKNTLNSSFINSISESTSEESFKSDPKFNNAWGYLPSKFNSSTNTDFLPAPTTKSSTIEKTETANSDAANNYDFTVAAKVDQSIPSGDYQETFVFSTTANEIPAEDMQNWGGCAGLAEHETVRLRDARDNKIYTVSKLKDGKCWMTQNLSLGGDEEIQLTPEDSDVSSNFTLPTSSTSGFVMDTFDVANVYVDNTWGGYYTWFAATAGTGTGDMSNYGQNATSSICPKGWKLPTGGSGGDFQTLYNKYNGASEMLRAPVPGFVLSGVYNSSSLHGRGNRGDYWSSTVSDSTNANNLYIILNSSSVDPTYSNRKGYGASVRCVAREKTMQTIDQWRDALQEERVVEAVDERDGNKYKVAKLKDGKIWMVENLRLVGGKTLTSSDSNVTSSFTLPESSNTNWDGNYNTAYVHKAANPGYTDQVYYTWFAATAGAGVISTGAGVNATSSICPKDWRLPKGGSSGESQTLYSYYNSSAAMRATPVPNFTLSGYYLSGSEYGQGSSGYYWSSTSYGSNSSYYNAYYLSLGSSSVNPALSIIQYYGLSVRCLTTLSNYSITYNLNSGQNGPEPNPQAGETHDASIKLSDTTPTREGYNFKGWCNKETSNESCSGTTYQSDADFPLQNGSNVITLWAMWGERGPGSCPEPVTPCSYGDYSGKRFGNGKCWMSSDFKTLQWWSSDFGCPSGWSTPTEFDLNDLISSSQAGYGACLYEQGFSGEYWSSYKLGVSSCNYLTVNRSNASVNYHSYCPYNRNVRCVSP